MLTRDIQSKSDLPSDSTNLRNFAWNMVLYNQKLQEQITMLNKSRFGKSSEKSDNSELEAIQEEMQDLLSSIDSLQEDTTDEESVDVIDIKPHKRYRRKHPGRNVIPEGIPHKKVIRDIPESEKICECCGEAKCVIDAKKHTVIERIPAKYEVTDYIRPIYACAKCKDSVSIAEPKHLPIPKGIAGVGLLCFVILSKYQFHLPLYRIQRQMFHESGIWFTRSTMVSWLRFLHKGIKRIHYELMSIYKSSYIKHADETPLKVRSSDKKGKHHEGRMWVGIGKKSNSSELAAVFYYNPRRTSKAAKSFLKGSIKGDVLMVDACPSYNKPIRDYGLIELNCMAHARRKFVEAKDCGYKTKFAKLIIRKIGQLYRIERWADKANTSLQKRGELRKKLSCKILDIIHGLLLDPGFTVLPDRKIGKAINYMLNHWYALKRYTENGEYPIDNNPVERIIRTLAIGRKNWMFAGSESGAKWMAAWYSIIATCLLNNINPHEYIAEVIQRLPLRTDTMSVKDLTPIEWSKNNSSNENAYIDYPKN